MYQHMLGSTSMESSRADKDLGLLVDPRLNVSQQCTEKANDILGCIRRSVTNKSRKVILPLYSVLLRSHMEYWVQFLAPEYKRDKDMLERIQ